MLPRTSGFGPDLDRGNIEPMCDSRAAYDDNVGQREARKVERVMGIEYIADVRLVAMNQKVAGAE